MSMFDPTQAGNYQAPKISSKVPSQEYKDNFDKIFGEKPSKSTVLQPSVNKNESGNTKKD